MTDEKTTISTESGLGEPANPPTTNEEEAQEQGYLGQPPDPNPNEDYTLEGVTKAAAKDKESKESKSKSSASTKSSS